MDLERLLLEGVTIAERELRVTPQQSSLIVYTSDEWEQMCRKENINCKREGVYILPQRRANVKQDIFLPCTIFHEYFGHGIFSEYSLLMKGEKIQNGGIFTTLELNQEGFALWTENLICSQSSYKAVWEEKRRSYP